MDLFEAIRLRRSVREFKPGDVPEADVMKILEAGRAAPKRPLAEIVHYEKYGQRGAGA